MLLQEIADTHDLHASTLVKMIDVLVKKGISIKLLTYYDDGGEMDGSVKSLELVEVNGRTAAALTYIPLSPHSRAVPKKMHIRPSELEQTRLKKQSNGSYLLTVPNHNVDYAMNKNRT